VLATVFFLTSLALAYLATHKPRAGGGVMDAVKTEQPAPGAAKKTEAPAADAKKEAAKDATDNKAKDVPN
jgi:preprotein translocase subunit SecG